MDRMIKEEGKRLLHANTAPHDHCPINSEHINASTFTSEAPSKKKKKKNGNVEEKRNHMQ
jgi:hypothetical protein